MIGGIDLAAEWAGFKTVGMCEIDKYCWVLGENVRGILSIDAGRTFGRILADLAESGYRVGWLCYGAGDVGAPHKRERVFIVGYSYKLGLPRKPRRRAGEEPTDGYLQLEKRVVADTNEQRTQRGKNPREDSGSWEDGEQHFSGQSEGDTERTTQCSLGRVLNGFSAGLDGHRWPAGPGEQYDWEPPRVATGVKDRVARLKALGNAVVPAQAYPILKAIAEIEGVGV